jgi:hypothetical protein
MAIQIRKSKDGNLKIIIEANGDIYIEKYAYHLGRRLVCNVHDDGDWYQLLSALQNEIPRNDWWFRAVVE